MREYLSPASDNRRWRSFTFRDGDVVISTPPKCGTTWTQMLVALLVFDSPDFPAPLTVLSPWLENDTAALETINDRLARQEHRRFIKTHTPLDGLPRDERAHYVVVGRDPRDVYLSLQDHDKVMDGDRWDELLTKNLGADELERRAAGCPDPENFAAAIELPLGNCPTSGHPAQVLHHLHDAWDRQQEPNVTLMHYADLLADTAGLLAQLAQSLGFPQSPTRCAELAGYASLSTMRGRATELAPEVDMGGWKDPAMFFSSGRKGAWRSTFNEVDLTSYEARVVELYPDEWFLSWAHNGANGGEWRHQPAITGSSGKP